MYLARMPTDCVVTGMGVITAIGDNIPSFQESLKLGRTQFGYLQRNGKCASKRVIAAALSEFSYQGILEKYEEESLLIKRCKKIRNASYSNQLAIATTLEAWRDAGLDKSEGKRKIALVVAGSNLQQQEIRHMQCKYEDRVEYIRPTYGMTFLDTDIVGSLSEIFEINGEGYTLGGASASGNLGIIHGLRLIKQQEADVVAIVGAFMNLSEFEIQGLRSLGAMGGDRFLEEPGKACRPFDKERDGFIYGEGCGCVILESRQHAKKKDAKIYGSIEGYGIYLDGNRNPNPSAGGEVSAMKSALQMPGLEASAIDYVNTHGTGSILGDEIEVEALRQVGLAKAKFNATKSLTGHALSAAGVIECIATLIQMRESFYHPTHNLTQPISCDLNWVGKETEEGKIYYALSNSFGFGGINTAIVIRSENSP